eukprot:4313945-Pyramimonas_sp.AAC.1
MMRKIFQAPRRDSESYVRYMRRSTRSVCLRAADFGATDWVLTQTQRNNGPSISYSRVIAASGAADYSRGSHGFARRLAADKGD